ncbi:hypothetical protein CH275_20740 [Rhodococcus sp. 06-235-1A]|uniref:TetR/AcrR family transcriptional regulator n=1 Tax=Rhodococcus sp. 06-235-1A TaxID=2022508 RepID=UPI000B9B8029|nr:TetR/AcrR family transcriptional regulator [Rhodococcus sp. 06-235-1A]OZD01155.1 hypothetical protein CH275_20740 [Rhodococcus sp. 06-235-1A]
MPTTEKPGRRDRKRADTRARIEEAALTLVLRDGLGETTVDAISDLADISTRTFFNYFESKDNAVLGVHPAEVIDELIADYIHEHPGSDLIPGIVGLMLTVMGSPQSSRARMKADRLEVVKRHPEILGGQMAQFTARASKLTQTIETMLTGTPFEKTSDTTAHAELLFVLCGGAVRIALREWATSLDDSVVGADSRVTDIERRAISLVHELREGLS